MNCYWRLILATSLTIGTFIPSMQGSEIKIGEAKSFEPIAAPEAAIPDPAVPIVTGEVCATGKCGHKDSAGEGCISKVWHWLAYSPVKGPCHCAEPTAYHPPFFAWFPCDQRHRSTGSSCAVATAQPVAVARVKKTEETLRMPEMPKFVVINPEKPLVPGSSTVLAEKNETPVLTPSNYKSIPVVPVSGRK